MKTISNRIHGVAVHRSSHRASAEVRVVHSEPPHPLIFSLQLQEPQLPQAYV